MAKKTLFRSVSVTNPITGQVEWFHPGDDLPRWAQDAITNPRAFIDPDNPTAVAVEEDESAPADRNVYANLSVDELRALAEDRGLDASGKKSELIERLSASDAALS